MAVPSTSAVPWQLVLQGRWGVRVKCGIDGQNGPRVHRKAILWTTEADGICEADWVCGQSQTNWAVNETDGYSRDRSQVEHKPAESKSQGIPVFVTRSPNCEAKPGMGNGYYVYSIEARVYVFNGCNRSI